PVAKPVTLCRRTIDLITGENSSKLSASLLDRLAQILGHSDSSRLNLKCTLTELGMESVMAIETQTVLEQEFGLSLSAQALREYTLGQLDELATNKQNENAVLQAKIPRPSPATTG